VLLLVGYGKTRKIHYWPQNHHQRCSWLGMAKQEKYITDIKISTSAALGWVWWNKKNTLLTSKSPPVLLLVGYGKDKKNTLLTSKSPPVLLLVGYGKDKKSRWQISKSPFDLHQVRVIGWVEFFVLWKVSSLKCFNLLLLIGLWSALGLGQCTHGS